MNADMNQMYDQMNENSEFEIRFGKFAENGKFSPSISYEDYLELIEYLKSFPGASFTSEYSLVVNHSKGQRVTQMLECPLKGEIFPYPWKGYKIINDKVIVKKQIQKIDYKESGIRLSLCSEENIKNSKSLFDVNNKVVFCKMRKRTTILISDLKFEISINQCSDSIDTIESKGVTYDVEMEILKTNTNLDLNKISFFINEIFKILTTENKQMYKKSIIKKYKKLTGKQYSIFNKPESINKDNFDQNEQYSITMKIDGVRNFIFIVDDSIAIINSKLEVVACDNWVSGISGTLIDSEVFEEYTYCFDILFYKGEDVRECHLSQRLSHLHSALSDINYPGLVIKEYIYENIYDKINEHLDENNNLTNKKLDGFIFVNINKPYHYNPLKWKPENLNTIDFKIEKQKILKNHETWNLLCYINFKNDIQFSYKNQNKLGTIKVDKEKASIYKNGDIVECKYDKKTKTFFPYRPRNDKTKPNNIKIAQKIYETILNPFDLSLLKPSSTPRKETLFFHMRRFHNYIKRSLLSQYSTKNGNLLDLACGKGGDLYKWVDNNIRYVEGYDNDEKSIENALIRYEKIVKNPTSKNFTYKFQEIDLSKENINTNVSFDIATCFFAIHYFFESESVLDTFIKNLTSIKKGGYFLVTTLCSEKLKELNHFLISSAGLEIYDYKPKPENQEIGESMSVYIKDSVLNEPRKEFITDYNYFIQIMNHNGFLLKETKLFSDYYEEWTENDNEMNDIEQVYSFMNRIYIFKKI